MVIFIAQLNRKMTGQDQTAFDVVNTPTGYRNAIVQVGASRVKSKARTQLNLPAMRSVFQLGG